MADAYLGKPKSTAPERVPHSEPPPSSLCPVCGRVEADAKHYRNGLRNEIQYACPDSHLWQVRWVDA